MNFVSLSTKFQKTVDWAMWWYCPGCDMLHPIYLDHPDNKQARWSWNFDLDNPTFSPSFNTHWNIGEKKHVCHTFIQEGKVRYLNDCTHKLAGKVIDLPDIPEDHL